VSEPTNAAELFTLLSDPYLERPVLVVCLQGWIDASGSAQEACDAILEQIDRRTVASFDTERLTDHRARRPTLQIVESVSVGMQWPEITLSAGQDATGNDVLVLHGVEPDHNWRSFVAAVTELAQRFGVRRVVGLGAYPAPSPHTRPSRLSATAATPELASLGFSPATLDVPAGVQAALELAAHRAEIEAVGLWVQVPHYVTGSRYPAAAQALLDGMVGAAGLVFDSSQLAADALAARNRLNALIDENPSHREMLRTLENQYDALVDAEADLASGHDLTSQLEDFLRSQNDADN
jgi:proteasome assembly chaperone (PAC2) family protein